MSDIAIPATGTAAVPVLHEGYVGLGGDGDGERVSGTVTLLLDGDAVTVVDPVASAPGGVYACTHAWWPAAGPEEDPLGTDPAALQTSRKLLLGLAAVIIPGHRAPFCPRTHA